MPNTQEKLKTSIPPAPPGDHNQSRQAVHPKNTQNGPDYESPGGTGIHRQALQLKTQRNAHKWMSRLAAM